MGQIWVKEFTGGLDTRKLPVTSSGGVLIEGTDGHISRGGEFEQRAAFVQAYTLPAGTVGLAARREGLVVFSAGAAPGGMPAGVAHQELTYGQPLARLPSYDLYGGKIYAVGLFADGAVRHYYDGTLVPDWFDGRARASFRVLGGADDEELTMITVGAVEIMVGPIEWDTTNELTAALVAAAINSTISTPDYTAVAVGDTINIVAATAGIAPNGFVVAITTTAGFVVSTSSTTMAGGAASGTAFSPGLAVRTIGSKMYSTSGSNLHFSATQQPTQWTTDYVGAGFIDMSRQASGSENLVAVAEYQNLVAIFAEQAVQIWFFDPDPVLNRKNQVLANTGTASPLSVTRFGDSDIFYLNESGLRSLKARDSSNAAATADIGVPVDTLITKKLRSFTEEERQQVIGLIEPRDGRFWLIMKDEVFVFSYFTGSKISAWSKYKLTDSDGAPFSVQYAVIFNRRVYLRSGNRIFVYGGTGAELTYDSTKATARLPYLDGNSPARQKHFEGMDVAAEGLWSVKIGMDPNNLDALDPAGKVFDSTYTHPKVGIQGASTHISFLFESEEGPKDEDGVVLGPAKLASVLVHFEGDSDED